MRRAVWILLGLLVISGSASAPTDSAGPSRSDGCEPAGPLDLQARLVSLEDAGGRVRATVEVALRSAVPAREARITASRLLGGRVRPLEDDNPALGPLAAGGVRRMRYMIDLERGQEHHIFFHVRADAENGEVASSVYLRVNLDPAKEPEDLGSLLQFRALPGGV